MSSVAPASSFWKDPISLMPLSRNILLLLTHFALASLIYGGVAVAAETEEYHGHPARKSEVIVKLTGTEPSRLAVLRAALDIDRNNRIGGPSGAFLLHSSTKSVAELIDFFSARADVSYVEPNYIYYTAGLSSDPYFPSQWALNNTTTPGADIHAVAAWDISTGSRNNIIAELDTGVDYTHPDLAANIWSAPAPFTVNLSWGTLTCPAGSHGYSALLHSCDPMDAKGHGTQVAGIMGAVGSNFTGVAGLNWTASIMGLQIAPAAVLGIVVLSDAIDAIEFAIQVKQTFAASTTPVNVRVLQNSWGGNPFSQALLDEINKAGANDMLFVAAAGNLGASNDTNPLYPASYNAPNVISVAATDINDGLAIYSDYGPASVHLGAPGDNVYTTFIGGGYGAASGTSLAAPYVAGAAALLLSACNMSTAAVKSTILNNVDVIPSLVGKTVTGGRLNALKTLTSCMPAPPPPLANGRAAFLGIDATTQGSWKGHYGSDGSALAVDSLSFPAYAKVVVPGAFPGTWASSTSDPRALQKSASTTDRIASTWYNTSSMFFDVNLTDGLTHRISLYLLDWSFAGFAERIDILDAVNGNLLDTQSVSSFPYGKYAAWNLAGHVQIRLTMVAGGDAVAAAIFFDPSGTAVAGASGLATFAGTDLTSQGTWKPIYGSDGNYIPNSSTSFPSYAQVSLLNTAPYTWAGSTTDVRALQKAGAAPDRIASALYSPTWINKGQDTFALDIALKDSLTHSVAIYLLDWDLQSRMETIDVLDPFGKVLDSRNAASFGSGNYFIWNLQGHVQIRITGTGGGNSVISGIFFGSVPDTTPPTVAITAPSNNSTVSSTVTISAMASDNVAVTDVQFQLDGTNLGADLTTVPYSISWNTTTASNGTHTLTAIARDTSHNATTSAAITVTVSNTGTITTQGLIGYWNFDEGSGSVAHDTSGSGYNASVNLAAWTTLGKINAALMFPGYTADVVTPPIPLGNTFSVSVWVNSAVNTQTGYARIAETQYNGGFYLGTDLSGTRYQFIVNTGKGATGSCGAYYGCALGGGVTAGWHLVTGTFDGTTATLYVDAAAVATETFTAPGSTSFPLYIGRYFSGYGYGWNGVLDEVRLYNRALTAAEVSTIATH